MTLTQNRTNGKIVDKAEYVSSTEVVVTYADFTKRTMTPSEYKMMHKIIDKKELKS